MVSSNEKAAGLGQVNSGIVQVPQVVRTNAATAEESAATSEELSARAEQLRENISIFKINNTGTSSVAAYGAQEKILVENFKY